MERTVFNKAQLEMLDKSGQWNEQTLKELGNAHYRTPYKQ